MNRLSGRWTPPLKLFNVLEWAPNQGTSTSVVFGYQREDSDPLDLIVSDVGKNTFGKAIALSENDFALGTQPQLAQDTVKNLAVMATSPSFGAAGGPPPVIWTIDLASGKIVHFSGVSCPGSVGCGYANGIGYDSSTGIACTTTELDGGLEFYNVAKQTGIHAQLPNGAGQLQAGAFVANDALHGLFLIAQPVSSTSGSGSSIQVYNESGTLEESINGFNFLRFEHRHSGAHLPQPNRAHRMGKRAARRSAPRVLVLGEYRHGTAPANASEEPRYVRCSTVAEPSEEYA